MAIIDDSLYDISNLRTKLLNFPSPISITLDYFTSFYDYLKSKKDYYVVFLDIEINDKENGLNLIDLIESSIKVIYLTNYDSYVYDAAHKSPFDFIRKKYLSKDFPALMRKLLLVYQNETHLIHFTKPELSIAANEILYFESNKNYEYCFTENRLIKIRITQKDLLSKLSNLPVQIFVKTHKTIIVNCNKIDQITSDGTIIMKNEDELPITIRNKKEIIKKILQIHQELSFPKNGN